MASAVGRHVHSRALRAQRQQSSSPRRATARQPALAVLQRSVGNRAVAELLGSMRVRVHNGSDAAAQAERLGAHAFTRGTDIFLGAAVDPRDTDVLTHELAHVVQQARGAAGEPLSGPAALESEAQAVAGNPAARVLRAAPSGSVQRLDKD